MNPGLWGLYQLPSLSFLKAIWNYYPSLAGVSESTLRYHMTKLWAEAVQEGV